MVFLPTAALGNSRVLVTLGHSGEVMGLYWPDLDYANNVRECMTAVYFGAPGAGRLSWVYESEWERQQEYAADTNILVTRLVNRREGLALTITDFVLPDADVLRREYGFASCRSRPVKARVFQYFDLWPGESGRANGVRRLEAQPLVVQHWHDFWVAVAASRLDHFQCGKRAPGFYSNAKEALYRGVLSGQSFEIGNVNFALGWEVYVTPSQEDSFVLTMAPGSSERAVADAARAFSGPDVPGRPVRAAVERKASELVSGARTVKLDPELIRAYRRCLLGLSLLAEDESGGLLAAPEFDPEYVHSGGYGYCWPRDAAEVINGWLEVGILEPVEPFLEWCRRTQEPEGFWHQRYTLSGKVGPIWSTPQSGLQIDQTASVLWCLARYYRALTATHQHALLVQYGDMVRAAVRFLLDSLEPDGLHAVAFDLWETFRGSFVYSNAAIYSALKGAAALLADLADETLVQQCEGAANRIKAACLERLWTGQRFARGFNEAREVDNTPDASILGVVEPFDMLSPAEETESPMVESLVCSALTELETPWGGVVGIRRYAGDAYVGGPPGVVCTLWAARTLLRVAEAHLAKGQRAKATEGARRAETYMRACLHRTTPTGLLPELMGGAEGSGWWAAPHGWAMASFLVAAVRLDEVRKAIGDD